jgi:predicted TIM-barrel fold metal-dependent hydrolase
MFGSNFPIEKLWIDYASLVAAHLGAAANLSTEDRDNIFWNTAERVYRPA